MRSIVRLARDWNKGILKDLPLDYSPITEHLYIAAWPTRNHVQTIKELGVDLIISTILETPDKELGQDPLSLVRVRAIDPGPSLFFSQGQLEKGVEAALPILRRGGSVLVYCRAGVHRSPTLTACILIGLGHSTEEAIAIVKEARTQADLNLFIRKRIRGFEKAWLKRQAAADP